VDVAAGGSDSYTIAVAHKEGNTAILDMVREWKPTAKPEDFNTEVITEEAAKEFRRFRISRVHGDDYGKAWVQGQWRKLGFFYEKSESNKSELYLNLLPMINSRAVDLLDSEDLVKQLVALERRTGGGARDKVDHPRSGHDDIANSVAGALNLAFALSGDGRDFDARKRRQYPTHYNRDFEHFKTNYLNVAGRR
jgi:hypothetical protein